MERSSEAKRILTLSLGKLYSSRSQRGGMRLQRSLQLSLVMRSAREIYHSAAEELRLSAAETSPRTAPAPEQPRTAEEPMETDCAATRSPSQPLTPSRENRSPERGCQPREAVAGRGQRDKENQSPLGVGRLSRKRRGKEAGEPEFLPSKRPRMEAQEPSGETPPPAQVPALRSSVGGVCGGSCHRGGDSRTALCVPLPRTIVAF
ncbi:immediate early response gene 2 protein [Amia ocellicauda]|uniref:immediate early response gene 2 protein n=1 Tax=Amia ocellicauda TaxID=2972642 RepID=UPI003463C118